MRALTLAEGHAILAEAFAHLCAGRLTAREYTRVFDRVVADTTAHPVRRVTL